MGRIIFEYNDKEEFIDFYIDGNYVVTVPCKPDKVMEEAAYFKAVYKIGYLDGEESIKRKTLATIKSLYN